MGFDKIFLCILKHLMNVYYCAKGHLPRSIFDHFIAGGLIQPPPQYQAAPEKPNINKVKIYTRAPLARTLKNGIKLIYSISHFHDKMYTRAPLVQ